MSEIQLSIERLPAPRNDGAAMLQKHIARILPILPGGVEQSQFANALMAAANEADLAKCNPMSVLMAAYNTAQLGLQPGKVLGLAYFVPFKGRCELIIGYRGYVDLAQSNRWLRWHHADVVCVGDDFKRWVDRKGPQIHHEPDPNREVTRDSIIGAYCLSENINGGVQLAWVNAQDLRAVAKGGVWGEHPGAMARKTAIRRAAKDWRLSPRMMAAMTLEDQYERDEPQMIKPLPAGMGQLPDADRPAQNSLEALGQDAPDDDADGMSEEERQAILAQERAAAAAAK